MSALGQKQTCAAHKPMSALAPKADMRGATRDVRFVPIADTEQLRATPAIVAANVRNLSILVGVPKYPPSYFTEERERRKGRVFKAWILCSNAQLLAGRTAAVEKIVSIYWRAEALLAKLAHKIGFGHPYGEFGLNSRTKFSVGATNKWRQTEPVPGKKGQHERQY